MTWPIEHDLGQIATALHMNESIEGREGAQWGRLGRFTFKRGVQIESLGQSFVEALDKIEKTYRKTTSPYWDSVGKSLLERLRSSATKQTTKLADRLEQRLLALSFREIGDSGTAQGEEAETLVRYAQEWKKNYRYLEERDWNEGDEQALLELSNRFPSLISLLNRDESLRERFFIWGIRDRLSVESFAAFPATAELVEKYVLGPFLHKAGPKMLAVKINKHGAKCLTIPLYGKHKGAVSSKPVKLWKGNKEVQFPHGYKAKFKHVLEALKVRDKKWVDFIISEKGIENWNPRHWGVLNSSGQIQKLPIENDWYRKIPVLQRLSIDEAKERYGNKIDGRNYAVALRASRRRKNRDVVGTHAFFDLCIPDPETNTYIVISPGKFSRVMPQSLWEYVKMFGDTVEGVIASHDPSVVYPWRQHTRHSVIVTETQFQEFADKLREFIIEARNGNFFFSIMADSCSIWSQKMMNILLVDILKKHKTNQNFFSMPMIDTEPRGILKFLLSIVLLFPKSLQPKITSLLLLLFKPWRGRWVQMNGEYRWVSAYQSDSWTRHEFDIPAHLFWQQENLGLFPKVET